MGDYYLSTGTGGLDDQSLDDDKQTSSGIMQTLFDIGTHDVPPLSAISASDFSMPAFDFTSSSSSSSTPTTRHSDAQRDGEAGDTRDPYDELTLGSGSAEWDALGGTMMGVQ